MMASTFAIKPGDSLTRQYPFAMFGESGYAIEVHGPNGFYRSFTGRADSRHVEAWTSYEQRGKDLTGNLLVRLRNPAGEPMRVEIETMRTRQSLCPEESKLARKYRLFWISSKVTAGMTILSRQVAQTRKRVLPAGWKLEGQALAIP